MTLASKLERSGCGLMGFLKYGGEGGIKAK